MHRTRLKNWLCLTAALAIAGSGQAVAKPPSSARKPMAVTDLASAVDQTAAVVEGQVTDISYEFNERDGPWTTVVLSDVRAHFGSAPERLEIRQLGGPLPDDTVLVVTHLPEFIEGERYVVFLRNTVWNLSPVVGDFALRVEAVGDNEALVTTDGHAVLAIDAQGMEVTEAPVAEVQPYRALLQGMESEQAEAAAAATLPSAPAQASASVVVQDSALSEGVPLDRQSFVAALGEILETEDMAVAGEFYERPAGEFKWYGQPTSRPEGMPPAMGGLSGPAPEIDTSRPID